MSTLSGEERAPLARGSRETTLLMGEAEKVSYDVELALPPGAVVEAGLEAGREVAPYGSYRRSVGVDGGRIALHEELELVPSRVPPDEYPAFARFVTAVDRAQDAEVIVARPAP